VFPPNTDDLPDDAISLDELLRRKVILNLAPDSPAGLAFAAGIAARDLPPVEVAVETAHRDAVIPLVQAGVGCALLPESEARAAVRLGATIRPVSFAVHRTCSLFFRRGNLSPAAQAFVDVATELSRPHD
jgi:DNA-binding transcriptional LysR family regulator